MNPQSISIVIPTTGNLKKMTTVLDSVYKNILDVEFEIYVVCNPQKTDIDFLCQKYEKLQIIQLEKPGLNAARQAGLERSKNEFVLFLDDDCEFTQPEQFNLLYETIRKNQELFAVGGFYSLPSTQNTWAKIYFNQQMQWLKSGVYDYDHNLSAYLIGGLFILNRKVCFESDLQFDIKMIFGGTEKDFFLQAHKKKLKMRLVNSNITHHSDENLFNYLLKTFKQGRGQKYIESKGLFFKPVYLDLKNESNSILFDLSYWSGYFLFDHSILKLMFFLGSRTIIHLNEKKISFLNRIKKDL